MKYNLQITKRPYTAPQCMETEIGLTSIVCDSFETKTDKEMEDDDTAGAKARNWSNDDTMSDCDVW